MFRSLVSLLLYLNYCASQLSNPVNFEEYFDSEFKLNNLTPTSSPYQTLLAENSQSKSSKISIDSSKEIIEVELLLSKSPNLSADDLRDLIFELKDIKVKNPIYIKSMYFPTQESLDDYINSLKGTLAEIESAENLERSTQLAEILLGNIGILNSEQLFLLSKVLNDISALFDGDMLTILGTAYSKNSLKSTAGTIKEKAKKKQHLEFMQAIGDEASTALGNGETSKQVSDYIDLLNKIENSIEEDETVYINGLTYNKKQVVKAIKVQKSVRKSLIATEDIQTHINTILSLESSNSVTSEAFAQLIAEYKALIESMKENNLKIIQFKGESTSIYDLEKIIDDLKENEENNRINEEKNQAIQEIEAILIGYTGDDGKIYIDDDGLDQEIKLWKRLLALVKDENVIINGSEYDKNTIAAYIETAENKKKMLEKSDTVEVNDAGKIYTIPKDKYSHDRQVNELVNSITNILTASSMSSDDIQLLIKLLSSLSKLIKDSTVTINGAQYNKSGILGFIDDLQLQLKTQERYELTASLAEKFENVTSDYDDYVSKAEAKIIIKHYSSILSNMYPEDLVTLNGIQYTFNSLALRLQALQTISASLAKGEIIYQTSDSLSYEKIPSVITGSESLTEQSFYDLAISSVFYSDGLKVIPTSSTSPLISSAGSFLSLQTIPSPSFKDSNELILSAFDPADPLLSRSAKSAPEYDAKPGKEYYLGSLKYILFTTFSDTSENSGKVILVPLDSGDYTELIIGLHRPTGLCYDKTHEFLYIIDSGDISQFQISTDDGFTVSTSVYVQVYSGDASDCKVDAFGNLLFTDNSMNSIEKIEYSDLYHGYSNSSYILYTADKKNPYIDEPVSIEVYQSEFIYFLNGGDGLSSGSLNKAQVNVQSVNDGVVTKLVSEEEKVTGMAYSHGKLVYLLEGGYLKTFDDESKEEAVVGKSKLMKSGRICAGEGEVYLPEQATGVIWKMNFEGEVEVFALIQAPVACLCV